MFASWFLRRAARKYARKLPHELARDYGLHEFYTEPDIRNAMAAAGLNQKYAVLGYARFLHRDHFDHLKIHLGLKLGYDEARELFVANEPIVLKSRNGFAGRSYIPAYTIEPDSPYDGT